MKLINDLKDDQFSFEGVDNIRLCARAVVVDQENNIALIKLHGRDIFGDRNYYELPGGGVQEGEELLQACKREMREEIACETELVAEIGEVHDYYNLIKRRNYSYYYLLKKVKSLPSQHLEEYEKKMIEKVVWVPIDTAIELMKSNPNKEVGKLVKQRELPILLLAKEIIGK